MWFIKEIAENDYGCEERMPGEPLTVLVVLESEDGRMTSLEVADEWLIKQELNEGDEWPLDVEENERNEENVIRQNQYMQRYMEALEELE